ARGKHTSHRTHMQCRRCGNRSFHKRKGRCASCGYPSPKLRRFAWQRKNFNHRRRIA
ncbi:MAG: 50S ribosomal protein L37e, partial [Candidatus Hodarchaeales archaeon]